MKIFYSFVSIQFFCQLLSAQVTYTEHIKPIMDTYCRVCHTSGAIGQVTLEDYESVVSYAKMIKFVTDTDYMPPWKANGDNLKITPKLSTEEKKRIEQWIQMDFAQGPMDTTIQFEKLETSVEYNMRLEVDKPYVHQGDSRSAQRVYVIETDMQSDQYVDAIAFIPSASNVVSSCTISIDTSDQATMLDAKDPKSGYANYAGVAFEPYAFGWYHWSPDSQPLILKGIGKRLPAGAKILLYVTYIPTNEAVSDSPMLLLKTRDWNNDKEMYTQTLINPEEVSKSFRISKGRTKIIYGKYEVDNQMDLHAIMLLGQNVCSSWTIYAMDPRTLDRIPIIDITEWEFQWLRKYEFKEPIVIPKGYVIMSEATYLNNRENENLPIFPTRTVKRGYGKKDELFGVVFDYIINK